MVEDLMRNFLEADNLKSLLKISGDTVRNWLYRTYNAYHGELDSYEKEAWKKACGEVLHVSSTKHKINVLSDNLRDLFLNSSEAPFTIEPTPIAELSKADEDKVTESLLLLMRDKEPLLSMNPELLYKYKEIEKIKRRVEKEKIAKEKAVNMTRLMKDQLEEGNFRKEFNEFLLNFCLYPYAVFYGPYIEQKHVPDWNGKKYGLKKKSVMSFKNISPFDYYWSSDTTSGGNGSYEFIKERIPVKFFAKAYKDGKNWIKDGVLRALEKYEAYGSYWYPNENPADDTETDVNLNKTGSIEMIRCFGSYKGKILKEYGLKVSEDDYYEIECLVCHNELVYIKVLDTIEQKRPIFTTPYRVQDKSVAGHSVYMMIANLEKTLSKINRMLIKNTIQMCSPIMIVDYSQLKTEAEELDNLVDRDVLEGIVVVDATLVGGAKAVSIENYPSFVQQLAELKRVYENQIDVYSGIPAMMHGTPQGSGANRTSSGIAMLYQQAIKQIQNAMMNLDLYFLEDFIKLIYSYNMQYGDESVKGDCMVKVRGSAGLILKEARKSESLESIQVLSQFANSPNLSGKTVGIIEKYVQEYLGASNADIERGELEEWVAKLNQMEQEVKMAEQSQVQEEAPVVEKVA